VYEQQHSIDVRGLVGGGAAGGLAGGLAAVGAALVPGFDVVADAVELADRIEGADLVVTGEGFLDEQSFHGKAVGGVVGLAAELDVPVLVVAGEALEDQPVPYQSLVARFGRERAMTDPLSCIREIVLEALTAS
jgi:glycerate kinase